MPPYIMAFFIAEFVLVMQFLWKYIDEIVGKGFSFFVLIELIFYFAVTIIPLAIPLTVMISAVMVFGNMGERYELSSMKSAGVSLLRIMRPAIFIAVMTGLFSLVAANYLKPKANYKFQSRFNAIRKQKASLTIEEKVFNKDFKDIVIRVEEKLQDGKSVEDVLIYDHSGFNKEDINLITAKNGEMYTSDDGKLFIMNLYDGTVYADVKENKKKGGKGAYRPFMRTTFREWNKVIDMSQFEMEASKLNLSRKAYDLMNSFQLYEAIDSFKRAESNNQKKIGEKFTEIIESNVSRQDSLKQKRNKGKPGKIDDKKLLTSKKKIKLLASTLDTFKSVIAYVDTIHRKSILATSISNMSLHTDLVKNMESQNLSLSKNREKHTLRFHQMYSWALICVIFLFIGAPLGSIVKKGGYGYPLLFAILFFMLFIIINIMGEKLNKGGTLSPILAAWFPCIFLIPFAIVLSYKAINDSDFSGFSSFIKRQFMKLPFFNKG